jgi:uncharacterized protein (TIGR03067 family)
MYPLVLVVAAASLGAPVPKIDSTELKKLQGKWDCVGMAAATEVRRPPADRYRFEIEDTRVTLIHKGTDRYEYTILRLGPQEIDMRKGHDPHKGDTLLGIWKVQGDELWLCYLSFGPESQKEEAKPRPKEFASPEDSGHHVYVLKRPEKK